MKIEKEVMPIYMDYSATTPVDPRVAEKMIPFHNRKLWKSSFKKSSLWLDSRKSG